MSCVYQTELQTIYLNTFISHFEIETQQWIFVWFGVVTLRDKGDLSPRSIIHYHLHIHILWNNSKHTTQEFLSINLKKKWERDFKKEKNWTVWSWITKRNFTLINYVINWYSRWRSHDEEHVQRIPQWTPFHETATFLNHLHVRRWLLMDSASEYILHVYLFLTDGARFEDSQGFKCGFFFGCLTVALWTWECHVLASCVGFYCRHFVRARAGRSLLNTT